MKAKQLFISLTLGLGLTLGLLWLLGGARLPTAHAAPSQCPGQRPLSQAGEVITVCLSGGCDYTSIQDAVDAAVPGDEILVVTGVYTDIHQRDAITQVVYISKTVTIRGGYNSDFSAWDPDTYSSTLNAQGQGRVLYITGDISSTIEGLGITRGNTAAGGGGVYIITATATLSNNLVFSNTAVFGGGLYLESSAVTLTANIVSSNIADWGDGGGLFLYYSNATLSGNTFILNTARFGGGLASYRSDATFSANTAISNTAEMLGGGLYLENGDVTLSDNTVISNTAGIGGGLYLISSVAALSATLSGNTVISNTAGNGGGLYLSSDDVTLSGNTVISNTAGWYGGGLYLEGSDATLINDVIIDNRANAAGSGLYIKGSSPRLLHTTVARNAGGDGSGVYVTDNGVGYYSTVALTNTILVSHTVGITVTAGNTVTLNATLWGSGAWANEDAWGGAGTIITGTVNIWGDPAFVNTDAGDYHIGATSAAIDKGLNANVTTDIDGDPRPQGNGYDLGADEFVGVTPIYLPLIMRQYQ